MKGRLLRTENPEVYGIQTKPFFFWKTYRVPDDDALDLGFSATEVWYGTLEEALKLLVELEED